jgi:ribonuclease Z
LNRQQDLHIFAPSPLQQLIELQLKVADTILPYNLYFHTIRNEGVLLDEEKFSVKCFRTNHRIECYGFVFAEKKRPRRLLPEKTREFEIPAYFYDRLTHGEDYIKKDGTVIKNEWVTEEGAKEKMYAFCADTKYDESIIPHFAGADLIYHETTYLDNLVERATARFHSTSKQAALIAQKAHVKKLLIGHFSSKYDTLEEFEAEARTVFENTELAIEGVSYQV